MTLSLAVVCEAAADRDIARLALLVLHASEAPPHGILLIRDDDNHPERRIGLQQARDYMAARLPTPIVIGLAHTKRECWILAGFSPIEDAEHAALAELRQELGFNPTERAEELTAAATGALRNAKRVLAALTNSDRDRERNCWRETELETLLQRGAQTGLAEFLREVESRIVPLFVR